MLKDLFEAEKDYHKGCYYRAMCEKEIGMEKKHDHSRGYNDRSLM